MSIGKLGLWVKRKTSQHIVVMDKRVQRILAIEARAGQVDGNWVRDKLKVNRECQMLRLHLLAFRK